MLLRRQIGRFLSLEDAIYITGRTPVLARNIGPIGLACSRGRGPENGRLNERHAFAEWRVRRVGIDYHVDVEGHFYSIPYRFARAEAEVRLTGRTIEIFARGERIAAH